MSDTPLAELLDQAKQGPASQELKLRIHPFLCARELIVPDRGSLDTISKDERGREEPSERRQPANALNAIASSSRGVVLLQEVLDSDLEGRADVRQVDPEGELIDERTADRTWINSADGFPKIARRAPNEPEPEPGPLDDVAAFNAGKSRLLAEIQALHDQGEAVKDAAFALADIAKRDFTLRLDEATYRDISDDLGLRLDRLTRDAVRELYLICDAQSRLVYVGQARRDGGVLARLDCHVRDPVKRLVFRDVRVLRLYDRADPDTVDAIEGRVADDLGLRGRLNTGRRRRTWPSAARWTELVAGAEALPRWAHGRSAPTATNDRAMITSTMTTAITGITMITSTMTTAITSSSAWESTSRSSGVETTTTSTRSSTGESTTTTTSAGAGTTASSSTAGSSTDSVGPGDAGQRRAPRRRRGWSTPPVTTERGDYSYPVDRPTWRGAAGRLMAARAHSSRSGSHDVRLPSSLSRSGSAKRITPSRRSVHSFGGGDR